MALKQFRSKFLEEFEIIPCVFDQGSFGNVYKVRAKPLDKSISSETEEETVIKLVESLNADTDSYVKFSKGGFDKIQREVNVLQKPRFGHRHITKVYKYWVETPPLGFTYPYRPPVANSQGVLLIQMELCDLKSLQNWFRSPWRNVDDGWILMHHTALGLEYLHSQLIIHRDLKPANILLATSDKGEVVAKIADFGLATDVGESLTSIVGTVGYISPERGEGGHHYSLKADIYSFGIILCQVLILSRNVDSNLETSFRNYLARDNVFQSSLYAQRFPEGLLEEEVTMIQSMTIESPEKRPNSSEVVRKISQIQPNIAEKFIPSYKFRPWEYIVKKNETSVAKFIQIPQINANFITILKIDYVTSNDLSSCISSIARCLNLQDLDITVERLEKQHYQVLPIPLGKLKLYKFNQLEIDPICRYKVSEEYFQKTLFFQGSMEQIAKNRMNVRLTIRNRTFVDIDLNDNSSKLCNLNSGCTEGFLSILKLVGLQNIKLCYMNLVQVWPLLRVENCTKLELTKCFIDIQQGKIFLEMHNLKTFVYSKDTIRSEGYPYYSFEYIPKNLSELRLYNVGILFPTSINKIVVLEELYLSYCELPENFCNGYGKYFKIRNVYMGNFLSKSGIKPQGVKSFYIPNFDLLIEILKTNWDIIKFFKFEWDFKLENSDSVSSIIKSYIDVIPNEQRPNDQSGNGIQFEKVDGEISCIKQYSMEDYILDFHGKQRLELLNPELYDPSPVSENLQQILEEFKIVKQETKRTRNNSF